MSIAEPVTVAAPIKPVSTFVRGLDGVVAVQTTLSSIDGQRGILTYRGIDIHELAEKARYEEVVYLLWYGKLPNCQELADLEARLAANRPVPDQIITILRNTPDNAVPMVVLRNAVSALAMFDPDAEDISPEATRRKAERLTAQMGTILTAYHRLRHGLEPIDPDPHLDHTSNLLYMLTGDPPDPAYVRALDLYQVLLADHGMNASTFTARVVASTQADLHSAIAAALGALKGPLHGGAAEATMRTLFEIGEVDKADAFVENAFRARRKIMGIGHRIYKTGDPRALHLQKYSQSLGERRGEIKWFQILKEVEQAVLKYRQLYANVDFFSSTMLYYIGIPVDMFTPMFAASRIAGWSAHVIEQYDDNVLIRPQSEFIGSTEQHYVPIDERE
ncbi:MAG: citrate synthase [Chloroflexi bacterium]|nr:citrate synthase [Chloroflexota bacterium]